MWWNAFSQKRKLSGDGSEVGVSTIDVHVMSTSWSMSFHLDVNVGDVLLTMATWI